MNNGRNVFESIRIPFNLSKWHFGNFDHSLSISHNLLPLCITIVHLVVFQSWITSLHLRWISLGNENSLQFHKDRCTWVRKCASFAMIGCYVEGDRTDFRIWNQSKSWQNTFGFRAATWWFKIEHNDWKLTFVCIEFLLH